MYSTVQTEKLQLRYEVKYFLEKYSQLEILSSLKQNSAIFREIYYRRYVNNIYFDTIGLNNYYDNVEGASERKKYRIRWYGEMFGHVSDPVLEIKSKYGPLGAKDSFKLMPFTIAPEKSFRSVQNSLFTSELPNEIMVDISTLVPTLLNRYGRNYYSSKDNYFRVTLDTDQTFIGVSSNVNSFGKRHYDKNNLIMELKYDETKWPMAHRITNQFRFRVTKSSKYVRGIDHVFY